MSQVSEQVSALPNGLPLPLIHRKLTTPTFSYHPVVLKHLFLALAYCLLRCKWNQRSREWKCFACRHVQCLVQRGSLLHTFERIDDGMNGMQASLSPQMSLAPTEMFDIEDLARGWVIFLSLWWQNHQCLDPELYLCLQTTDPFLAWVASLWLCPVSWHILLSLLLSMLPAGCRALMITSANLHRASIN